jgi:AcrR family transcriptional regulator
MSTELQERRNLERQARRRKIQRVARRIFSEQGFGGATIEEIARASSLSVGAIYLYFKSKEELYISLVHESLVLLEGEIENIRAQKAQPRAQLAAVWERFAAHAQTFKELHRVILLAAQSAEAADLAAQGTSELDQSIGRILGLLGAMVEEGIACGEYREESRRLAADLVWGSCLGLVAAGGRANLEANLLPAVAADPLAAQTPNPLWQMHFETLERGLLATSATTFRA